MTRTVLVVDSDLRRVTELATALRVRGYHPLEATTFEAAKRLWIAQHPAMLIADVRLGQFNGLQLLLRARADRPDLKAIITCAFEDKVLEAETQRFGGAFLVTPIAPEVVVEALLRAVSGTDRRQEERRRVTRGFFPERRVADRRRAGHV